MSADNTATAPGADAAADPKPVALGDALASIGAALQSLAQGQVAVSGAVQSLGKAQGDMNERLLSLMAAPLVAPPQVAPAAAEAAAPPPPAPAAPPPAVAPAGSPVEDRLAAIEGYLQRAAPVVEDLIGVAAKWAPAGGLAAHLTDIFTRVVGAV